jgi:hypothetical protein
MNPTLVPDQWAYTGAAVWGSHSDQPFAGTIRRVLQTGEVMSLVIDLTYGDLREERFVIHVATDGSAFIRGEEIDLERTEAFRRFRDLLNIVAPSGPSVLCPVCNAPVLLTSGRGPVGLKRFSCPNGHPDF